MESFSETRSVDGARVEVGAIVHDGRTFAALGSVVDEARGLVVGYVARRGGRWMLTTWAGAPIMTLTETSTYRGLWGVRVHCWCGYFHGRRYSGRNGGSALVCRLYARA